MKLNRISAIGLKGPEFSHDLTDATVLYGRNFRGKTRVIDAIRLALLGYLPELGKRNQDTFGLASGPVLEVKAFFDTGLVIRRRWSASGNSVKSESDVPEELKAMGDLSTMLDASAYFGLSDRARVDYVFAHCPVNSSMGPDDVVARVEKKLLAEQPQEAVTRFVLKISAKEDDQHYPGAQAFLDAQIEAVAALWKDAKAAATRLEKTIQGLTDLRLKDEPATPMTVLEDTKAKLTRELAELNEQKGRFLGSFTQMKADRQRRETIEREMRFADKNRQALVELRAKLDLVRADLAAAPVVEHTEIQRLWSEVSRAANLAQNLADAAKQHELAKTTAERKLAELDAKTCCPYCGADGDGWKALNAAELAKAVDEAKELAATAAKQRKDALADEQVALRKHEELVAQQNKRTQLTELEAAVLRQIAQIEPALQRLDAMSEELKRLMPDDPELTAKVETIQTKINITNEGLRTVDAQIREANGRAHEVKRLADAEKERDEAKLDAEVAALAGKELRAIQAEMVEQAFKPLLTRANAFFADVLKSPIAYNPDGGAIGSWRGGVWVGHATMSGTERALVYAAIQAALAMQSPFKLMLLDELGRLDDENAAKTVQNVVLALKDGLVDQFIGIDAGRGELYRNEALENPGFTVVEVQ